MRSEALKLAQKRYREKVKNNPVFIERRRLAQIKYRQKNYERCLEINRNSNKKQYNEIDNIKEHKKNYYLLNRNYRNLDTLGKSISKLFSET